MTSVSLRVTVVCSILDLVPNPFDGLAVRHAGMIDRLIDDHHIDLTILVFESAGVTYAEVPSLRRARIRATLRADKYHSLSRGERLRGAANIVVGRPGGRFGRQLRDVLAQANTDVYLTIGPYYEAEFRPLFGLRPTVHLFEEDAMSRPDLGSTSKAGRALRRVEELAGYFSRRQPASVVVIADGEQSAARRRFRAPVSTLNYALPESFLEPAGEADLGGDLLVMGALDSIRNAEGLAAILDEMRRCEICHIPVRLVSDGGLHPSLEEYLCLDWVSFVPSAKPARANYDGARMALSPSAYATGIKTTILQAWARAVPVVTYTASANTLKYEWRDAVRCGENARGVVQWMVAMWEDGEMRNSMSRQGRDIVTENFHPTLLHERLITLLRMCA